MAVSLALAAAFSLPMAAQQPAPIEDNSFLLEEAYNQEPGVVQHINTFLHARRSWSYSFTQEWPLGGQRHQGSFTVPIADGRLGDVALNYRHQVLSGERVAVAPRLSMIVPRGGPVGVQANVPVSILVVPQIVTHWNAGVTVMRDPDETTFNAGTSVIWLVRPMVNVMLELAWTGTTGSGDVVVNPGLRWAHNVGRLQIVPGIAFPDGRDVFLYLSFEHPFKSIASTNN
jgi:hypothetical protein